MAQGYKDVKERSAIVKFKLKDEEGFVLAWTTTPWTLPSNVGLCVNPNENYAKVAMKEDGTVYYLAEALCDAVLGADTYEVKEAIREKNWNIKNMSLFLTVPLKSAKNRRKKLIISPVETL